MNIENTLEKLKIIKSNREIHQKFKKRIVFLNKVKNKGLLSVNEFLDQYERSLEAYAKTVNNQAA